MATIRSAGIHGLIPVATAHGVDPVDLVLACGLDPAVLTLEDLPIADNRLAQVYETAAVELGLPDLGLQVAQHESLDLLGPLALVIATSATAAEAIEAAQRYLGVYSGAHTLEVVPDPRGDADVIGLELQAHGGSPAAVQSMDSSVGFLHRALSHVLGPDYGLVSVELGYRPAAPIAVHEAFFAAPVAVGRPTTMLRVRADLLDQSLSGADQAVHRTATAYLQSLLPDDNDLAGRVRRVVRQLLAFGPVSINQVARTFATQPRTLQRLLAESGVRFGQLVDDERREEAQRLLTETDLSLVAVSARLGFAEQATLTRACRRWWGVTPSQVRA